MQIFDTSLMKTTTDILIDTTHVTLFFPEYIMNSLNSQCDSISTVAEAGFLPLLLLLCPLQMPQVSCVSICFVNVDSHHRS